MKTHVGKYACGIGVGAGLMYAFDPGFGRRRRALGRDKLSQLKNATADAAGVAARDMKNRSFGILAGARRFLFRAEISDSTLTDRVRAELGFLVSHPRSIEVAAHDGVVALSGPVLAREMDRLLRKIGWMRGVKAVENRLEAHESADAVPGLQGEPVGPSGARFDILQSNWAPATRWLTATAGSASLAYAIKRRDALGATLAIFSGALLARALSNLEWRRLTGIGAGDRAIDIYKTIHIAAPVEDVFAFWSRYENFPRFMADVREVRKIDERRSHWVFAGPAGAPVEWDALVTHYAPNRVIGWKSEGRAAVRHTGRVRFMQHPGGATRVDVRMSYNPPAGGFGHGVAALFGADPATRMEEDLLRMKNLIESESPRPQGSGQQVH